VKFFGFNISHTCCLACPRLSSEAGDPHYPDRVRANARSGRRWLRCESLARPGANARGLGYDYRLSSVKGLELQIAPHVTRAAVLRDTAIPQGIGQFAILQAAAPSLGLENES
jgi:hypothetical protein